VIIYFCTISIIINTQTVRKQIVFILLSGVLFFQKSIINKIIENNNQNKGSTYRINSIIQLRTVGQASVPHPSLFKYKKNQIIGRDKNTSNNRNIRL
jgi:hypothetical protein